MNAFHHRTKQLLIISVLLIAWLYHVALFNPVDVSAAAQGNDSAELQASTQNIKKSSAHLYFANTDATYLSAEKRIVIHADTTADFGKQIVVALLKGPRESLGPTIPKGTQLRAFFLTTDGIAYVDLTEEIPGMIIDQRGFEANLKVIKTREEMLGSILDIIV